MVPLSISLSSFLSEVIDSISTILDDALPGELRGVAEEGSGDQFAVAMRNKRLEDGVSALRCTKQ